MSRVIWIVASVFVAVFGIVLLLSPVFMPFDIEDELLQSTNRATDFGRTPTGNGTLYYADYPRSFMFYSMTFEEWNEQGGIESLVQRVVYREGGLPGGESRDSDSDSTPGRAWVYEYELSFKPDSNEPLETRIRTPRRELLRAGSSEFETVADRRLLWHRSSLFRGWVMFSGVGSLIGAFAIAIGTFVAPARRSSHPNHSTNADGGLPVGRAIPTSVEPPRPQLVRPSSRPVVAEPSIVAEPIRERTESTRKAAPATVPIRQSKTVSASIPKPPEENVGMVSPAFDFPTLIDELVHYVGDDGGFAQTERIRLIGYQLETQGGMSLMQQAYSEVRRRGVYFSQDIWHMIGEWRN